MADVHSPNWLGETAFCCFANLHGYCWPFVNVKSPLNLLSTGKCDVEMLIIYHDRDRNVQEPADWQPKLKTQTMPTKIKLSIQTNGHMWRQITILNVKLTFTRKKRGILTSLLTENLSSHGCKNYDDVRTEKLSVHVRVLEHPN